MADETVVETPVETGAAETSVETPVTGVETPVEAAPTDPNDPMAALEAAMNAQLGEPDPAEAAQEPPAQADLAPYLGISPFVKEPGHIEAAVRAADEVWAVASGQKPARDLFEGIRQANPQAFQTVINDVVPYIEQITGKRFGEGDQTPPDPLQQQMNALEARIRSEDERRQAEAFQQQVTVARTKATELVETALKGTFGEGMSNRFVGENGLVWAKAAQMNIPAEQMMNDLLSGNTKNFERVMKAVKADEIAVVKQYNANLIKHYRSLSNGVPAVKGAKAADAADNSKLAPLPGESAAAHAKRLWDQGLV